MSYNPDPLGNHSQLRASGRRPSSRCRSEPSNGTRSPSSIRRSGFSDWFFSWLSMSSRDMEERDPNVPQTTEGNRCAFDDRVVPLSSPVFAACRLRHQPCHPTPRWLSAMKWVERPGRCHGCTRQSVGSEFGRAGRQQDRVVAALSAGSIVVGPLSL